VRPTGPTQGEERLAECPSDAGRRDTRAAASAARTGVSSHVFMTERDGPMTPKAFHALFGRIGARAKLQFPVHPHMLRHGCGYALANAGHDTRALQAWLGHKNIQHSRHKEAPTEFGASSNNHFQRGPTRHGVGQLKCTLSALPSPGPLVGVQIAQWSPRH
jgi:hypothetical protein